MVFGIVVKSEIFCKEMDSEGKITKLHVDRFNLLGAKLGCDILPYAKVLLEIKNGADYQTDIEIRGKKYKGKVTYINDKKRTIEYLRTERDNIKINNLENVPRCTRLPDVYVR